MHLVGFTIGIYYDARTHERQIYQIGLCQLVIGDWCLMFQDSMVVPSLMDIMCSEDGTAMLYWNIRHQSSGVILQYPR